MLPETGDFPGLRRQWLGWLTGLIEPRQELLHLPNGMAIWMVVSPHPLGGLLMTFENVTYRLALERSVNTLAAVHQRYLGTTFESAHTACADMRATMAVYWAMKETGHV